MLYDLPARGCGDDDLGIGIVLPYLSNDAIGDGLSIGRCNDPIAFTLFQSKKLINLHSRTLCKLVDHLVLFSHLLKEDSAPIQEELVG